MAYVPSKDEITEEQSRAVEKAAFLVIAARNEAAEIMTRAGIGPVPEQGWFGSPCAERLPFPPRPRCGCTRYSGDGGPCRTRIRVPITGPGSTHPFVPCGHDPSQHLET
jgi:hypothetical protein